MLAYSHEETEENTRKKGQSGNLMSSAECQGQHH